MVEKAAMVGKIKTKPQTKAEEIKIAGLPNISVYVRVYQNKLSQSEVRTF